MERKHQVMYLIGFCSFLLQACGGKGPLPDDVVGRWVNSDGASLNLHEDGSFTGSNLPAQYFSFFTSIKEVQGKKVDGKGEWKLEDGQGFAEIKLHFKSVNNSEINAFYSVFVSGENGILDNKPPWYLFVWEGEEGGERYKFLKKS